MRPRISAVVICGLALAQACQAAGPTSKRGASLVRDGLATGRIIAPAPPTAAEWFAAEELQSYIRKVTGASLPIVATNAPGSGAAVVVGDHPHNRPVIEALRERYPDKHEALAVVAQGDKLSLVSTAETGKLYAAWDWIEHQLGVRWFFPTESGEYVPKRRSIVIEPIERFDAPHADWRACSVWTTAAQQEPGRYGRMEHGFEGWRLFRHRTRTTDYLPFAPQDRWYSVGSPQAYGMLLPVGTYGKDHPEWFNRWEGKQPPEQRIHVNFTHPQAAAQYAHNALQYVETARERGYVPERIVVWNGPNDGVVSCELAPNRALTDDDGSVTSMVIHFGNEVAARIRAEYPEITVVHHAYSNHSTAPDKVMPARGTGVVLAHWVGKESFAYNHAQPGFSDANATYRDQWHRWAKITDHVGCKPYYGHYNWCTPFPMITQMARDFPAMADTGKFRYVRAQVHSHWGTQSFTFYLLAKLSWDPYLDVDRLLHDYCTKAFGPAGEQIEQYYRALQAGMDALPYVGGRPHEIPRLLTPGIIAQCDRLIDEAESKLADMDPATRWRTRIVIEGWRASALIGKAAGLFIASRDAGDRQRILDLYDEVEEILDSEWGALAFETKLVKKRTIGNLGRRALSKNLAALAPGDHRYHDDLAFGGATKFHGSIHGFEPDAWGLKLGAQAHGTIDVPIAAAPGHRIEQMSIQLEGGAEVDRRVLAITDDGAAHVICEGPEPEITVLPPGLVGAPRITLRIEAANPRSQAMLTFTSLSLDITIAK
ncbi:MAG: hypothetical protein CMJ18_16965 [Phycisphaeraceae bacterium]|nr:hypothetical protein [Phycisphaeraceae bacterium]